MMSTDQGGQAGAVPFSEWMRRALFDPQRGYYARRIRAFGRRGDFATAPGVSDVIGEAVARWLRMELRRMPSVSTVIEVGGGDGSLMRSVRGSLGYFARRRLQFFMVEISPVLRERQISALRTKAATWFDDLPGALEACGGCAFIFHNELLDAFPVTLVEWDGSAWQEVWLAWADGRWTEERRALRIEEAEAREFSALSWPPATAPQRVELGTAARSWLRDWAPVWRRGTMLTLDYGGEFPELYERRPRGTVRAYRLHQRITGGAVYENMGSQDITADVNFTDLVRWGGACGWEASSLEAQADFLRRHLPRFDRRLGRESALRFLVAEGGAGTAFRALVQRVRE